MNLRVSSLTILCACGTTMGTGGPLTTVPTVFATAPDVDLHIIDINTVSLKGMGDRQTDPPDTVDSRYYWSAAPDWGPIEKIVPKRYEENKSTQWQRTTTNRPITAVYRTLYGRRLLRGPKLICYTSGLELWQQTGTDADADPTALTDSRLVGASSHDEVTDVVKNEVSCEGFDKLQNIDKGQ